MPQREPQALPVGVRGLTVGGEHLGHTAQQLREDRPGVPAGANQRTVRHGLDRVGERRPPRPGGSGVGCPAHGAHGVVPGEDRLDRRGRRLHGQIEVRPGVPVGHGIDVDGVDLRPRPPQRLKRETAPGAHRESIECLRHLRHLRLLELLDWTQRRPRAGPFRKRAARAPRDRRGEGRDEAAGKGAGRPRSRAGTRAKGARRRGRRGGPAPGPRSEPLAAMVVSFHGRSRCMLLRLPDLIGPSPWHRHSDPPISIPACRDQP
ncbi:hypothetical protein Save01_09026 [Streptomyces avermitilis]